MTYSYDFDMSQPTLRDFPSTWSARERGYFGSNDSGRASASSGTPGWAQGAAFLGNFLTRLGGDSDRNRYRRRAERDSRPYGGGFSRGRDNYGSGSFNQIAPDISVYIPPTTQAPQRDPIFIPGGGGPVGPTTGQRLARAGGGALGGAAQGAAIGSAVPGIGTAIGAGVGAIMGGLGGLFG